MRKIRCQVDGEMDEICIFDDNVIDGNLDLSGMDLEELPDLSDITVTGSFRCANNYLRSLEGAPQHVDHDFDCNGNVLYTLKGAPQKIGGDFNCANNYLSSLEGAPQHVGGSFDCSHNHSLKTLKGAPQFVGRDFICRGSVPLTPKSKLDLPQNIRGRCEIQCLEQASVAEQEVEVEVRGADFSEEKCAEMAEKILADFKQKQPELFVSTKKEKTKKDTAENNSVSLAIKTKKKTLGRARQKSKQDTKKRDDDVLEMECAEMAENILAKFKQEHPELFVSTKKGETKKDTAENNSVSLAIKTKKGILDRARQKSK